MQKHLQEVPKTVLYNNNLDYFAAHFDEHLTPKPTPQKGFKITYFEIISTLNPIGLIKIWGK